ncbi:MAG: cysteine synthase A [Nitrospinota bacterium]|nr:cysteine synthase A [Nitrospinota bacterium]
MLPDVLSRVGSTPLIELKKLPDSNGARVFAKIEQLNPGGSVKDRIALNMVLDAERRGLIEKGSTIIEPTSGNTGIGLAMVGAVLGYNVIIVLSESMSHERKSILANFGAEVILSPSEGGMYGSVVKANEILSENPGFYMPQQFNNQANPEVHRNYTVREILRDMGPKTVGAFVAGVGTGGTITGVGDVLKSINSGTMIVAVEPKGCAVLSGEKPGPHRIQGIGAGFIPNVLNLDLIDKIKTVSDQDAYDFSKALSKEEGILAGISSGAATFAAVSIASEMSREENVVVILPDSAERYYSLEPYFG